MPHPYQCLAFAKGRENESSGLILAARGPRLLSINAGDGSILSHWSANQTLPLHASTHESNGDEQPRKKQKIDNTSSNVLNIIKLTVSSSDQHAVVVTEDKCLHVVSISDNGTLEGSSQRIMPKRPCAVHILPDDNTILVGDKFGDVYSLPLTPSTEEESTEVATDTAKPPARQFKISASTSTVHSKRNLQALEAQRNQKNFTPRKEPLAFAHNLLLGHVSMLTDMVYARREVEGKQRGYIITADRDEHIRISRQPPQAHIIEGYCLGHKHFVSKLCLVPGTDFLVSGGGDDWLGIWDWPTFTLRRKLDVKGVILSMQDADSNPKNDFQVVVSGLWTMPASRSNGWEAVLVVACESVPALLAIPISSLLDEGYQLRYCRIAQNPLDVIRVNRENIMVSIDERKDAATRLMFGCLDFQADARGQLDWVEGMFPEMHSQPADGDGDTDALDVSCDDKKVDDLLYGVAGLRKRGGWDEQGKADGDQDRSEVVPDNSSPRPT